MDDCWTPLLTRSKLCQVPALPYNPLRCVVKHCSHAWSVSPHLLSSAAIGALAEQYKFVSLLSAVTGGCGSKCVVWHQQPGSSLKSIGSFILSHSNAAATVHCCCLCLYWCPFCLMGWMLAPCCHRGASCAKYHPALRPLRWVIKQQSTILVCQSHTPSALLRRVSW